MKGTTLPDVPFRIGILRSVPLVHVDSVGGVDETIDLDFEAERRALFESFTESGRLIEARVDVATAEKLRMLVTLGYRVLHYTGHGSPNTLSFEDGLGGEHLLETSVLRDLVSAGGEPLVDLAFVSACHSRTAGEAFASAGVPHVVAVKTESTVYDS